MEITRFKQQDLLSIVNKHSSNWKLSLSIKDLTVKEQHNSSTSLVICDYKETCRRQEKSKTFESLGSGIVDALFLGFFEEYKTQYRSLIPIKIQQFSILNVQKDTNKKDNVSGTSGDIIIVARVCNSRNVCIPFEEKGFSILFTSSKLIEHIYEFFINAEIAVIRIINLIKDESRNRMDLKEKYLNDLSLLVDITSYEEILKK